MPRLSRASSTRRRSSLRRAARRIVSLLGTAQVLPYLVAAKSLRRSSRPRHPDDHRRRHADRRGPCDPRPPLRRSRDRAASGGAPRAVPAGRRVGAVADRARRPRRAFWIALEPHTVTLAELPEVAAAIATNRSFSLVRRPAAGGRRGRLERRLTALCGTRGWRYRPACCGITGSPPEAPAARWRALSWPRPRALGEAVTADAPAISCSPTKPSPYGWRKASQGSMPPSRTFPIRRRDGDAYAAASRAAIGQLLA